MALGGKFAGEGFVRLKGCTEEEVAEVACKQDLVSAIEVEDHQNAMAEICDLFKPLNVNGGIFKEIIVKSFGVIIGRESTDEVKDSMNEGSNVVLSVAETAALAEESVSSAAQEDVKEKVIDEAEDDSAEDESPIPDNPFTEIRDISAAAPTARKARVAKKTMIELVAEGTIKAGDTLRVKKSPGVTIPGSEGKVIDGKFIEYKGESMTFNAWVESIAGTRGATPYMYGIVEDGRSIEQVRNGVTAEEAKAKRERRSSRKAKKDGGDSEKEGSADADPEPVRSISVPARKDNAEGSKGIHEMAIDGFNIALSMKKNGRFNDDINGLHPASLPIIDDILLNGFGDDFDFAGKTAALLHAPEFIPFLAAAGARVEYVTRSHCKKSREYMSNFFPGHGYSMANEIKNADIVIFNSLRMEDPKADSFASDIECAIGMIGRGREGTVAFICNENWKNRPLPPSMPMRRTHFGRIAMHSEDGAKCDSVIMHMTKPDGNRGVTEIIDADGGKHAMKLKIGKNAAIQDAMDRAMKINRK